MNESSNGGKAIARYWPIITSIIAAMLALGGYLATFKITQRQVSSIVAVQERTVETLATLDKRMTVIETTNPSDHSDLLEMTNRMEQIVGKDIAAIDRRLNKCEQTLDEIQRQGRRTYNPE